MPSGWAMAAAAERGISLRAAARAQTSLRHCNTCLEQTGSKPWSWIEGPTEATREEDDDLDFYFT